MAVRIHTAIFFSPFFSVMLDGLSERGTTWGLTAIVFFVKVVGSFKKNVAILCFQLTVWLVSFAPSGHHLLVPVDNLNFI